MFFFQRNHFPLILVGKKPNGFYVEILHENQTHISYLSNNPYGNLLELTTF